MDGPKLPWLVFAIALVALVLMPGGAGSGPGWGSSSAHAVLAVRMDHLGSAPLYGVLAQVFALVPVGEPGFRLALVSALLGAATLAGIVVAARTVAREPGAAVVAAALVAIAAPFRDAAAFASPAMLAACGTVWAIACAARDQRDSRDAVSAFAACAIVVGSAPWLGGALVVVVAVWLRRKRTILAPSLVGLGLAMVALWLGATGDVPSPRPDLGALADAGHGAAAIVLGAGLLGIGFGALTGLTNARWLGAIAIVAAIHEALFGGAAAALVSVLAIGTAIVPSAIVRMARVTKRRQRLAVTLAAGAPLLVVAIAAGPTIVVEDPADVPTQLAFDLTASIPPGPGLFVATRAPSWLALRYEMTVAGARPDLALVPPLPPHEADVIVANALRGDRVVGADAAAFGRLDVRFAIPRGRGFQLVGGAPRESARPSPPAHYATTIGREQAVLLALERARHEAASGRLDMAARALGLETRFRAADLAMLATALPTPARPALFGFLPLDERPTGPWLYDVFGDDLAWVAGLDVPAVDASAPMARRLHAKWREILSGKAKRDDPAIAAMGPRAVAATKELFGP